MSRASEKEKELVRQAKINPPSTGSIGFPEREKETCFLGGDP